MTLNTDYISDYATHLLRQNPKVLKTPEPTVVVTELTDSAVKLAVRPWANNADFGDVTAETLESGKTELYNAGIEIQPFVKEASKMASLGNKT